MNTNPPFEKRPLPGKRILLYGFLMGLTGLGACRKQDGTIGPDGGLISQPGNPGKPFVVEYAKPWIAECDDDCENAYLQFIARHSRSQKEVTDEMLYKMWETARLQPPSVKQEMSQAAIAKKIKVELGIENLVAGIETRPLASAVIWENREGHVIKRKLLFWDPEIGSFEGMLLLPAGPGPHPAILGLHGHRDSDEDFAVEFMGMDLAEQGFAVLMPRFRAMDCSRRENNLSMEFLRNGLTLMGMRVYETLLMDKYLRHLGSVNAGRLGVLAHSGGCSVADLTARLSSSIAAKVTDHSMNWYDGCGPKEIHCESIPSLMPFSANLDHGNSLQIPLMKLSYKFKSPAERESIVIFFKVALLNQNKDGSRSLTGAMTYQ